MKIPAWEFRAHPNDNLGTLEATIGSLATSDDNPADAAASINVVNTKCSCIPYLHNMLQTTNDINSSNVPYKALSFNSNAAVTTALGNLGVTYPQNPPVSAPGWGVPLPLRH